MGLTVSKTVKAGEDHTGVKWGKGGEVDAGDISQDIATLREVQRWSGQGITEVSGLGGGELCVVKTEQLEREVVCGAPGEGKTIL